MTVVSLQWLQWWWHWWCLMASVDHIVTAVVSGETLADDLWWVHYVVWQWRTTLNERHSASSKCFLQLQWPGLFTHIESCFVNNWCNDANLFTECIFWFGVHSYLYAYNLFKIYGGMSILLMGFIRYTIMRTVGDTMYRQCENNCFPDTGSALLRQYRVNLKSALRSYLVFDRAFKY